MLTKVVKNLVKTMVFANLKNQHQTSKIRTKLVSLVRIFNVLVLIFGGDWCAFCTVCGARPRPTAAAAAISINVKP